MKTEIAKNTELFPGDVIELHFKTRGGPLIDMISKWVINKTLGNNKTYKVIDQEFISHANIPGDIEFAIYTVEIIEPPEPSDTTVYKAGISAAAIGYTIVAVLGFAAFAWSLQTVYKITQSPAGGVALGLIGLGVILYLLKSLK